MSYLTTLIQHLQEYADEEKAVPMKKYMKERFEFLGIRSPERRLLTKGFYNTHGLPPKNELEGIVVGLYSLPQREYHYTAIELADRLMKKSVQEDIFLLEYLLEHNQWWDTIDFIAANPVGRIFKQNPELIDIYYSKWNNSSSLWMNRAAILFQLKYKSSTDLQLLSTALEKHASSKEFFHQKAIGWALREYAKTDPEWVKNFVSTHKLSNLSKREAMKNRK